MLRHKRSIYCCIVTALSVEGLSLESDALAVGRYKHHTSLWAGDVADDVDKTELHNLLLHREGYGEE